jgi:hypothetical protein
MASPVPALAASACRPVCALVAHEPQTHLPAFDGEAAVPLQVLDRLPDRASLRGQSCSHQLLHRSLPRPWHSTPRLHS